MPMMCGVSSVPEIEWTHQKCINKGSYQRELKKSQKDNLTSWEESVYSVSQACRDATNLNALVCFNGKYFQEMPKLCAQYSYNTSLEKKATVEV